MADFAELVTKFSSTGYDALSTQLDGIASKSKQAERATDGLSRALRSAGPGARQAERDIGGYIHALQDIRSGAHSTIRQLPALGGGYKALDGASSFLGRGIQSNAEWEQSRIGIASVIAAINTLTDAQGNILTGQDAYNAALNISEQAMNRMKIMGLETTATTGELVAGFQQLVGPASAAGLNMEQTLSFTTQMAKALDAIGIPFNQLSAEGRSLLDGTIVPAQDRLATTLGITGDMVRDWKQQGVLAQKLMSYLEPYALAGGDVAKTWAGVTSNMQDALNTLSGTATQGLYENLKAAAQEFTDSIVDVNQGQASDNILNLSNALESLFDAVGGGVLEGTRELIALMGFLNDNVEEVKAGAAVASGAFAGWAAINKSNLLPALAETSAAISGKINSCTEAAQAARLAAEAEVAYASKAVENAVTQEQAAQAAYAKAKANMSSAVSSRQVRQASAAETATFRELLAAQTLVQAQTDRLSVAQQDLSIATKKAGVLAKTTSVAWGGFKGILGGLLGALGGPAGASLTALGAGAAYLATKQSEAEKGAALHARSLETLTRLASDAAKENKNLGDKLGEVAEARRGMAIDEQTQAITTFAGAIKVLDFSSATGFLPEFRDQASALDEMADAVFSGKENFSVFENALARFYNELKKNGEESSRLGERIKKALDLATQGAEAETVLRALRGEAVSVAGTMDDVATAAGKAGSAITAAFDPQRVQGVMESLSFKTYTAGLTELQRAQAQALKQAGKTTDEIKRIFSGQDESLESNQILWGASAAYKAEQGKKTAEEAMRRAEQLRKKAETEAKATARAMADLEVETNRLSLSDEQFREYKFTTRLAELREELPQATALIDAFEQATRKSWETENKKKEEEKAFEDLQFAAGFHQKLAELSGGYSVATEYQNQLLEAQARIYAESLGPGQEKYVERWKELMQLQNSRDYADGITRGVMKWTGEYTNMAMQMEGFTTSTLDAMMGGLLDFSSRTSASFSDMTRSILQDLARITARMAVAGLIRTAVGFFSAPGGGTTTASVTDNPISGAWAEGFMSRGASYAAIVKHGGGMALEPSPTRRVPASLFEGAPRYQSSFINPASERAAIIRTDESVLTPGQMKAIAGAGGASVVNNISIVPPEGYEGKEARMGNATGGEDIRVTFGRIAAQQANIYGSELNVALRRQGTRMPVMRSGG